MLNRRNNIKICLICNQVNYRQIMINNLMIIAKSNMKFCVYFFPLTILGSVTETTEFCQSGPSQW